jgi:hypothetical protein
MWLYDFKEIFFILLLFLFHKHQLKLQHSIDKKKHLEYLEHHKEICEKIHHVDRKFQMVIKRLKIVNPEDLLRIENKTKAVVPVLESVAVVENIIPVVKDKFHVRIKKALRMK